MFSEMECPGGQVYEACGSTCERTCRSLSGAEPGCEGERVCEEGCFCPAGKYLSPSGECVTADMCPCLHDGQLYQPSDVYADHNSIWYVIPSAVAENGLRRCMILLHYHNWYLYLTLQLLWEWGHAVQLHRDDIISFWPLLWWWHSAIKRYYLIFLLFLLLIVMHFFISQHVFGSHSFIFSHDTTKIENYLV